MVGKSQKSCFLSAVEPNGFISQAKAGTSILNLSTGINDQPGSCLLSLLRLIALFWKTLFISGKKDNFQESERHQTLTHVKHVSKPYVIHQ